MNYLAHQYLSFQNKEIQLGNLYGEVVRGRDFSDYPRGIQIGIKLHRQIDSFTDSHDTVRHSTSLFHENHGKYSPVIVDVLYDYFLIKNWDQYCEVPFEKFVKDTYTLFRESFDSFPPRLQYIMTYLLKHDWFHKYRTVEGIAETLRGISHRTKFENNIEQAVNELIEYEDELNDDFNSFFPEIISFSRNFIEEEKLI